MAGILPVMTFLGSRLDGQLVHIDPATQSIARYSVISMHRRQWHLTKLKDIEDIGSKPAESIVGKAADAGQRTEWASAQEFVRPQARSRT